MSDLPKTAAGLDKLQKREKDIGRTEAGESFKAALSAVQNDPKAQAWLKQHSNLWLN